ncbi:hypothetical protein [Schlesneria sp. T3-172]|uniref:hypothetical protein n=1 Tax=Schlesneria sphaerica TaxID=3373610 RepID=UPI0037CA91B4
MSQRSEARHHTERTVSLAADPTKHAPTSVRSQPLTASQPGAPPDSMRSQFRLPPNTTSKELLSVPFLEATFRTARKLGCVREIEWQDFVGLAVNCCDLEKIRPAALFTWTMRNGIRNVKRGTQLVPVPWTAVVRNEDMDRARELLSRSKPPEYRARTSNLDGSANESLEYYVAKAEGQKAAMNKKLSETDASIAAGRFANILGVR